MLIPIFGNSLNKKRENILPLLEVKEYFSPYRFSLSKTVQYFKVYSIKYKWEMFNNPGSYIPSNMDKNKEGYDPSLLLIG